MTSTIFAHQASKTAHVVAAVRGPRPSESGQRLDHQKHITAIPGETTAPRHRSRAQPQAVPPFSGLVSAAETVPCIDRLNSLIAFYQMELPVTDAQLPHWNAFADAVRNRATRLRQLTDSGLASTPHATLDRLKDRIAWLSAERETMTAILSAAQPLYAAMNTEQQAVMEALAAARAGMLPCDA